MAARLRGRAGLRTRHRGGQQRHAGENVGDADSHSLFVELK
jgi:ribosomal protein L27